MHNIFLNIQIAVTLFNLYVYTETTNEVPGFYGVGRISITPFPGHLASLLSSAFHIYIELIYIRMGMTEYIITGS